MKRCFFLVLAMMLLWHSVWAAPVEVAKALPKSAISLRWQELKTGAADGNVWLHLWCVPKGRSREHAILTGEKRSGPIGRSEITLGPSLETSPFALDVFRAKDDSWQLLNSLRFQEDKDAHPEIVLRWLDAQKRRGPVVVLHFGYTHWHEWQVLTFPDGWNRRAYSQQFLWGGEGGTHLSQRFDKTDARGRLLIHEEESGEHSHQWIYRWNGREWSDDAQKYFVIGATTRTQKDAETVWEKRGWGEVLHSNDYPRLQRNYWLWVAGRYRTLREANELAQRLKGQKIAVYVRRAR